MTLSPIMLRELADRVEAAAGPDRDLDRAVMEALGRAPDYAADWGPRSNCRPAPFAYTSSLDAAMTLVPEGAVWGVGNSDDPSPDVFRATVMPQRGTFTAFAATPALALTAACLRAIAEGE